MQVELELTGEADAYLIHNMWPGYVHELTEFSDQRVNRHGLMVDEDEVRTLAEQVATLQAWWRNPDSLFPYLIRVDGQPAGFNLIATGRYVPDSIEAEFVVHEFFVLHPFRGKRVAELAAIAGFERHPGTWEVVTYPNHGRAIAFWRRVIGAQATGPVSEVVRDHHWGHKVVFTFENGG